jgi:N6-adenosine-specific RNA methylase IME4
MSDFSDLPRGHYGAILADPPWRFEVWGGTEVVQARESKSTNKLASVHYRTMTVEELAVLPVENVAATDCALFIWICWPTLREALDLIDGWGFSYKTCAFSWMKAHASQIEMFRDDIDALMGMGYWTRANNEVCLLATRGKPKRLNADVRQGIIAPRREHSRKPDGVHERIERLVSGPYLELFARSRREGWDSWGNEVDKFKPRDDFAKSIDACYEAVRERQAADGKGWDPK